VVLNPRHGLDRMFGPISLALVLDFPSKTNHPAIRVFKVQTSLIDGMNQSVDDQQRA
jgi:hypothetical protein